MQWTRFAVIACCAWSVSCAGRMVMPAASPSAPATEALLVLPGFGYGREGEQALRSLAPSVRSEGMDLFVPSYVARSGLDESRRRLQRFIRDNQLERYHRVHVFAFLAGGWTFNPLADGGALPNLATVIYDRSPYQERAPRLARETLPILTWLKYGRVVFDVARTPYFPLVTPRVHVGLLVETTPTPLIRRFSGSVERYGPYRFECDAFGQRYDDCLYVALSHDQLYPRFAEVWPELRSFIQTGRFTQSANRTAPAREAR